MQAMVLTAPREVANQKVKIPDISSDETLIKVTKSGICGTDLKIFQGGIPVNYPRILGHESVGEVVSGGNLAPGTPIIVDPAYYCGHATTVETVKATSAQMVD